MFFVANESMITHHTALPTNHIRLGRSTFSAKGVKHDFSSYSIFVAIFGKVSHSRGVAFFTCSDSVFARWLLSHRSNYVVDHMQSSFKDSFSYGWVRVASDTIERKLPESISLLSQMPKDKQQHCRQICAHTCTVFTFLPCRNLHILYQTI